MIWVMLFTGILLGWVIEWVIDTFRYNRMIDRLQLEHDQAVIDITNRYESTLSQERSRHEEHIGDLQERHRAELNLADIELNSRLTEQTAAHRRELESNKEHLQNELKLVESQRRDELSARDKTYAEAKRVLEEGFKEQVLLLEKEHEQRLRETGVSLRNDHEKEHSRLKKEHGAELEALETRLRLEQEKLLAQAQNDNEIYTQNQVDDALAQRIAAHDQEKDALNVTHQNELRELESRLRKEYDDSLASARQESAANDQAQFKNNESRLQQQFDAALAEQNNKHAQDIETLNNTHHKELQELEARIRSNLDQEQAQQNALHRNEVAALKADYEQRIDELTLLSRSIATSQTQQTPVAAKTIDSSMTLANNGAISHVQQDDLTIIEGIGPKANNLLHNAGINSYSDLAGAEISTLQHILDDAGSRFRLLTPDTWPKQASLAAQGDWDALDQLKDQLDGGKPAN